MHRDVSPQNVLLSYDGAVKIADFGIATANLFRDEPGVLKGKYGYMSPEQARGEKVDRRGDIYALGVVLHELLTGRPLHGNLTGDSLLEAVRAGVVEPPSTFARDVPPELEALVMRALAKNADDRFQSARDMSAAISRALFQKQEFVDAAAVEATIARLAPASRGGHRLAAPLGRGRLAGPRRHGRDGASAASDRTAHVADVGANGDGAEKKPPPRPSREVRHVAVVTSSCTVSRRSNAGWALPACRAPPTRSARRSTTSLTSAARASHGKEMTARARLVGLMANPARAAADAAWLALDVHEALAGASEDLVTPIRASIGIVRGIATGERDQAGNLVHHQLQEPANLLSNLVGERAPAGATWVAGGLYRLVRREFRWGDAPTIELGASREQKVPASMRIYALQRALTREERVAELAMAPHDLVGRDAEKADLHAAYHRAVSGPGRDRVARRHRRDGHRQDGAGRHVLVRAPAGRGRAARRVLAGALAAAVRHRERVRARGGRRRRRSTPRRSREARRHDARPARHR